MPEKIYEKSQDNWTIGQIIEWSTKYLAAKNSESARLDAELLLSDTLKCKRIDLYLTYDKPLKREERDEFKVLLQRRAQGEPIAYILGKKEFLSREYFVSPAVLIPRPETELIVEEAVSILKKNKSDKNCYVLDIGTGSGCIAISLALAFPDVNIIAWDKSSSALDIAQKNAKKLGAQNIEFDCKDVLEDRIWDEMLNRNYKFNLVVSNPPYIGESEMTSLNPSLGFEPRDALIAADDGFQVIKVLSRKTKSILYAGGHFLVEIGSKQGPKTRELLTIDGWQDICIRKDYAGNDRFLIATESR